MQRLLTDTSVRKPAGGVAEVVLTPVSNIREVRFVAGGRCRFPACVDASRCLRPSLVEGLSSLSERSEGPAGAELITRNLILALDPADAAALAGEAATEAIRAEGAAALVRTESGRLLLCGYSARFGGEQPLRWCGTEYASGSGLRERPLTLLRFRCADTDPAAEVLPADDASTESDPTADRVSAPQYATF